MQETLRQFLPDVLRYFPVPEETEAHMQVVYFIIGKIMFEMLPQPVIHPFVNPEIFISQKMPDARDGIFFEIGITRHVPHAFDGIAACQEGIPVMGLLPHLSQQAGHEKLFRIFAFSD
jgi:hypothetical protein